MWIHVFIPIGYIPENGMLGHVITMFNIFKKFFFPIFQFMFSNLLTNNLRYSDDTTLMAESEEELKSILMEEKKESKKVGLKHNIQKT